MGAASHLHEYSRCNTELGKVSARVQRDGDVPARGGKDLARFSVRHTESAAGNAPVFLEDRLNFTSETLRRLLHA